MEPLDLQRMQDIQKELQEKYQWMPMTPENGHYSVLWSVAELGEVIDIIKKKGPQAIMEDPDIRKDFITELCDVFMYLNDTALCFHISPEEMSRIYEEKHAYNMHRWK